MCSSMKADSRCWSCLTFSGNSNVISRSLVSLREPRCQPRERVRTLAEVLETRILRLPPMVAAINLLDNHGQLEYAEHFVVPDPAHVAAGEFGVSFHQFIARVPSRPRGQRGNAG